MAAADLSPYRSVPELTTDRTTCERLVLVMSTSRPQALSPAGIDE